MAFTYAIATDRGKTRLKLADTDSTRYAFEDDEIDLFLSEGGSVTEAVILGLRCLLVDAARRHRAFSLPGVTYDDKGRVAALKEALAIYGADMPTAVVFTPASQPFDRPYTDLTPPTA